MVFSMVVEELLVILATGMLFAKLEMKALLAQQVTHPGYGVTSLHQGPRAWWAGRSLGKGRAVGGLEMWASVRSCKEEI